MVSRDSLLWPVTSLAVCFNQAWIPSFRAGLESIHKVIGYPINHLNPIAAPVETSCLMDQHCAMQVPVLGKTTDGFFSLNSCRGPFQHYEREPIRRYFSDQLRLIIFMSCVQSEWFFSNRILLFTCSGHPRLVTKACVDLSASGILLTNNCSRGSILCLAQRLVLNTSCHLKALLCGVLLFKLHFLLLL